MSTPWSAKKKRRSQRFQREALTHLDALYRFARCLTKNPAQADDLVQETCVKALAAFDQYQEGTNCKAWLFRIMKNTFLNQMRNAKREVSLEPSSDHISPLQPPSLIKTPEATVLLAATGKKIREALQSIPPDFRTVVLMADVEEFSYREIAEIVSIPIGTVMSRLYRGRRLLRERLCDEQERAPILQLDNHRVSHGGLS